MTPENIQIVKESAAVLGENAEALTRLFYQRLFEGDPQVKAYFNEANQHKGEQQQALAGAVVAYAINIEDPSVLGSAVELIAHKHVSLGIQPDHYPIVGKHLLGAIKELLGDQATDELINAWAEAYATTLVTCSAVSFLPLAFAFVIRSSKTAQRSASTVNPIDSG